MALIQFTKNHTDHSTDRGFQFEFFCDRCGNGFMTEFQTSATGMAASALGAAGSFFGGMLGRAATTGYDIERAVQGPAHDKAFRQAIEDAKPNFKQCPHCTKWVCQAACWNATRSLCLECAPDLETEMATAQVQATVQQMKTKIGEMDLTKGLDLAHEAVAACPACGAATQGAKFCPECGHSLRSVTTCAKCHATFEAGTKFCPQCGQKTS